MWILVLDEKTGFFQNLAIDLFGKADVEGAILPIAKLLSKLKSVGLKFIFDVFLATDDGLF